MEQWPDSRREGGVKQAVVVRAHSWCGGLWPGDIEYKGVVPSAPTAGLNCQHKQPEVASREGAEGG